MENKYYDSFERWWEEEGKNNSNIRGNCNIAWFKGAFIAERNNYDLISLLTLNKARELGQCSYYNSELDLTFIVKKGKQ